MLSQTRWPVSRNPPSLRQGSRQRRRRNILDSSSIPRGIPPHRYPKRHRAARAARLHLTPAPRRALPPLVLPPMLTIHRLLLLPPPQVSASSRRRGSRSASATSCKSNAVRPHLHSRTAGTCRICTDHRMVSHPKRPRRHRLATAGASPPTSAIQTF